MSIRTFAILLVSLLTVCCRGAQVFTQAPNPAGGLYKSAWYPPDGLDGDEYAFDNFTLATSTAITEIRWRGGYTNYAQGAGRAPVFDFTIAIYRSIAGGSQPDLGSGGRLVRYSVGGNAGETAAGSAGGYLVYDYAFVLPTPFQAVAGTKYWVQIEASQGLTPTYYWPPDWSVSAGLGGNNSHFRRITGGPMQTISGDLAFSLYNSDAATVTINASSLPADAGTITGAGAYPINSLVSLFASPNTGWGFVNWTENGSPVSSNSHYNFTATVNRTLVANFVPTYTVTTYSYPSYGGTVTGAGTYNSGSTVTLVATPNHGFVFAGWSDGETSSTNSFPATTDIWLTAFFDSAPNCATFDFDDAPVHTSLPIDLSANGLGAHFSATGEGYSIQPAGTFGINPPGFEGLCVLPNSVFPADLIVDFSEPLVDFSILYSPQELGCDDSATMRATAYMDGVFVGTHTTTAPLPGTWPSATLSIAVPTGFNRVVVHYDARPPTCQDWGPIFMADNVTVTRMCVQPAVANQPVSTSTCALGVATFSIGATGSSPAYRWRVETPFGSNSYVDLTDGDFAGVGLVSGSTTPDLTLSNFGAATINRFRCSVSNTCGSATSDAATLSVCAADFDCDSFVTGSDYDLYVQAFEAGDLSSDFDGDGFITGVDFDLFVQAFEAGC